MAVILERLFFFKKQSSFKRSRVDFIPYKTEIAFTFIIDFICLKLITKVLKIKSILSKCPISKIGDNHQFLPIIAILVKEIGTSAT